MWNRFTQSARRCIWHIEHFKEALGLQSIEPDHILLALLIENNGISAQIFEDANLTLESVKAQIPIIPSDPSLSKPSPEVEVKMSEDAKRVLELAFDESRRMNLNYIGAEHILLGLLRQKDSLAAQILTRGGVNLSQSRLRISRIIFGSRAEHRSQPTTYEWLHPSLKFEVGWNHVAAVIFLFAACALATLVAPRNAAPGPFLWKPLAFDLPPSIQVHEGVARNDLGDTFRAWRAEIDLKDRSLRATPSLVQTPSGREKPSTQAQKVNALVAINGGYFDVVGNPAKTYSLVLSEGRVLCPNVEKVGRGGKTYFVTRSAFGITKDRKFDVAWVGNHSGKTYRFASPRLKPIVNSSDPSPEYSGTEVWPVETAIGGGPRLVHNGKIEITYREELFPGAGFPDDANYSRAAIGGTKDGRIVLFVTGVKGSDESLGLTLRQLASEMKTLGCEEAMNLDGGGSQSLVVLGKCINSAPQDPERETTSIFAIQARH
jgi:hypothetical protein